MFVRAFLTSERCELPVANDGEVIIRRAERTDEILLSDPSISRSSGGVARMRIVNGQVVLAPGDSNTPLLVNGVRLHEPQPLRIGDRVRVGYSVLVIQGIDHNGSGEVKTIPLGSGYVRERVALDTELDRIAQWCDGFDQMRSVGSESEAAEVVLEQLVRLGPGDRVLLATNVGHEPGGGLRELCSCGLSAGEVERILRWLAAADNLEVQSPTVREVLGVDSGLRTAVGRLGFEDVRWIFYLEPAQPPGGLRVARRCLAVASNMLGLYGALHANAAQQKFVEQLRQTVRVYTRPGSESTYQEVASRFVFRSEAMRAVCGALARAAAATSPVLLLGEPGTGKQLAAEALHAASDRRHREMVSVSLKEYPETLVESALFGHAKGSFTGALDQTGLVAHADGSSLFLDEIGEIPSTLQTKLLRVLERGEFRRLGELHVSRTDVRLISATNRDLPAESRQGRFRQDLFDRISVIPITLPPLRDRLEDVPMLAEMFLRRFNEQMGKQVSFTAEGLKHLRRCSWPDNVRGLKNYVERTVALADYGPQTLGPDQMPPLDTPRTTLGPAPEFFTEVVARLRESGRVNQARILGTFGSTTERLTKSEWASRLGVSRPVFRAELRRLVAFGLNAGMAIEFFENRVSLRPEDWLEIDTLRSAGGTSE